ncbi:FecR family protein [Pedobacter agri]|uniref:FecR family protein n=1 Tax=Pedobacter agri TaxID=454586 RepID=UPI00292FA0B9|nr:FecR domain-containing protein [Pedobacter agri]
MENTPNIRQLFIKYLDGTIDHEGFEQLRKYFGEENSREELHNLIIDALYDEHHVQQEKELQHTVDHVQQRLRQKLEPAKASTVWLRRYLPYAAIVLILLIIGISYYILSEPKKTAVVAVKDVNPGTSGATLTLANGKKIRLNAAGSSVANEAGISIRNAQGKLVYKNIENDKAFTGQINTLSTANGETYNIVLVDGTKVWLNAGSTLTYNPNLIESGERVVKVAGEAYFEVTKDKKHPFVVNSNGQRVEVLGTHFNINTYKGKASTITTLAEGSVKITTKLKTDFLKPGQQSITANSAISVQTADLETALAWKDGKMYFKDAELPEVMTEIARWYNVQVEYVGKPAKALFNGGFKRTAKLSEVLQILNASNVHCKLTVENKNTTIVVNTNKPFTQ